MLISGNGEAAATTKPLLALDDSRALWLLNSAVSSGIFFGFMHLSLEVAGRAVTDWQMQCVFADCNCCLVGLERGHEDICFVLITGMPVLSQISDK